MFINCIKISIIKVNYLVTKLLIYNQIIRIQKTGTFHNNYESAS